MIRCHACTQKAHMKVYLTEKDCRSLCLKHFEHWNKYGQNTAVYYITKIYNNGNKKKK